MAGAGTEVFDVAVIGGGPAGAAAALSLARQGRRALLVDQTAGAVELKIGEGLPPGARPLLRDLGVLGAFLEDGHLPSYGNQSAWGSSSLATLDFIRDPGGHGWHLDRARFDATLRREAALAGAELRAPARLSAFSRAEGGLWRLVLEPEEPGAITVESRFLVDATGRAASVARRLGAAQAHDDRLVSFSALYLPAPGRAEDEDSLTLVESVPDGWWYTALLPGRRRIVAFLGDADLDAGREARTPAGFDGLLAQTERVRERLEAGGYRQGAPPRGGPASTSRLSPAHGEGWVAIGDAALAFDPLSSQGILTALYAGLRSAGAIDAALAGEAGSVARFCEELGRVDDVYRQRRRLIYAEERRWADRPFWRRRA